MVVLSVFLLFLFSFLLPETADAHRANESYVYFDVSDTALSGRFEADLEGTIAELPVTVDFGADGYQGDTPFRAHIVTRSFSFGERSSLLPFAPGNVRDLFERLSSPSASRRPARRRRGCLRIGRLPGLRNPACDQSRVAAARRH